METKSLAEKIEEAFQAELEKVRKAASIKVVTPDRIIYSSGRTVSQNYNSKSFNFTYGTDVQEGETLEQATERAIKKVDDLIASKLAAQSPQAKVEAADSTLTVKTA